jgi:hypothetical protein
MSYGFGQFSLLEVSVYTPSSLNLARVPLKTCLGSMEIRELLVATPVPAILRFHPTRWHLRRAGTGRQGMGWRCRRAAARAYRKFNCGRALQEARTACADRLAHEADAALADRIDHWLDPKKVMPIKRGTQASPLQASFMLPGSIRGKLM